MKRREELEQICPVRSILDGIGNKWAILIIDLLGQKGILRFNEINKSLGDISQKMLSVTLRSLETDGIVSRKVYPEIPPKVEYELTAIGENLLPNIQQLIAWGSRYKEVIIQNRADYKASHIKSH